MTFVNRQQGVSEEVSPGVVLDFNERNQVVGIEMLSLSKPPPRRAPGRTPNLDLREFQFQTA